MAGREDSIAVRNVLEGYLNADNNAIASSVGTAYNPTYALVSEAGAQIVLFINNADYKMYAQLKDKNGNLLYTSNIIDLPLESVVMNGRYDSITKEVVLTLVNGNEIRFSVEDLVRGLVDEDQLEEALSGYWSKEDLTEEDIENWNNKQNYLNQGENVQIYSDLTLKGNIEQDGEPTPQTPIDIHIVSGDNEIKVCNKNLINSTAYNKAINTSGVVIIPATTTNYLSINDYVSVKPNTTYTISFEKEDGGRLLIGTKDQNGEFIERTDLGVTRTFTTGNNVYQAFLYLYKANGSYTEGGWVQLEQGTTTTDYVEHQEYTKEINLGNLEVGSIGEYEDEFFKNTTDSEYYDSTLELDKWYLKKRIGKAVLDGSENWNYNSGNKGFLINNNQPTFSLRNHNVYDGYCDYFSVNKNSTTWVATNYCGWNSTNTFWVKDNNEIATNADDFKTWLSTHNTIVYYVLATPENILLNDTLQEQLNGLSADLSNKEMINIIQENNDLPFIINYDNTKLTIDVPCASADQGGVIKTSDSYATATADGVLTSQTKTYVQYNLLNNNAFVSKGTLENVLDKYIGDIDTALDAINGEEV